MVFRKPIYHSEGMRIIPNFTRYAVSKIGEMIDRVTNQVIRIETVIDKGYYPMVTVINELTGGERSVGIHRIVALAWCDNDDYHDKVIVNHKNGDKHIYESWNLEWSTYSENMLHAYRTGLRPDNLPCKIRSIKTGEIREYHSFGDLSREFKKAGPPDPTLYTHGSASKLLNGEWEVRAATDERDWHYKVGDSPVPKSQYVTTVSYPDGQQETYWDNRDIIKKFKCWNTSSGIWSVIQKARELHPELTFDVLDRREGLIIQTLDVATMTVVDESKWVRNAAELMKCSRGVVERYLRLNLQRPKNGYAVRYKPKEETPWELANEESVNKSVRIQLINTKTNESRIFNSLRELEQETKISRFIAKQKIGNGQLFGDYRILNINA